MDVVVASEMYGESIERNSIHGSDSPSNAAIEVGFFFAADSTLMA